MWYTNLLVSILILSVFHYIFSNFQLHMYTSSRFVNRKTVTIATKIPTEEMKVILEQIALKTKDGWEFRLPFDQAFVDKWVPLLHFFIRYWNSFFLENRYPEVVRRHDLMNKAKQKQLQIHVGEFKAPKKEPTDTPKKRTRRRSRQDSCSSDSGSDVKK